MSLTEQGYCEGYCYIVGLHSPVNFPEETHARAGFYQPLLITPSWAHDRKCFFLLKPSLKHEACCFMSTSPLRTRVELSLLGLKASFMVSHPPLQQELT